MGGGECRRSLLGSLILDWYDRLGRKADIRQTPPDVFFIYQIQKLDEVLENLTLSSCAFFVAIKFGASVKSSDVASKREAA
jgi:hypothetical protein